MEEEKENNKIIRKKIFENIKKYDKIKSVDNFIIWC